MNAFTWPYHRSLLLNVTVFLSGVVCSIVWQEPILMLIPFTWVLLPIVFETVIIYPEKLFWLLLIVLPLSTELNITPQLGFDFPDEILLVLLTGITIVKLIHQPKLFPYAIKQHSLFMVLVIYIVWLLICSYYSEEPILSAKYVLAKTWYIIPFVLLPQLLLTSQDRIRKMAICFLVPMVLVVIQTLLRHSYYLFSFEKIQKTLAPFFRNHVNYSSMLVCLLPVGWCVWKLTPTENAAKKWIWFALLIGLIGLVFAYSRGAWMALLLGITAAWVIKKNLMRWMVFLAIAGVTVSVVWLVTDKNYLQFAPDHDKTIFHTDFSEHMQATVNMKDVSTAERFYRWIAGARMLAEKPITGFGPNTFYLHYKPFTVSRFETWVSDNKEHSTVHNYFILIALEQGVIGLLLFCILYFGMLLHIQKLYHQFQSRFYRMVTLATGIVLVMIGVINSMSDMIETDKIGSLFWLCLGMIILLEQKSNEEKEVMAK